MHHILIIHVKKGKNVLAFTQTLNMHKNNKNQIIYFCWDIAILDSVISSVNIFVQSVVKFFLDTNNFAKQRPLWNFMNFGKCLFQIKCAKPKTTGTKLYWGIHLENQNANYPLHLSISA